MTTAQLIATLIPLLVQYSPQLIADVATLIHGNPQQQGETDQQYIARMQVQADQIVAVIDSQDADIQS